MGTAKDNPKTLVGDILPTEPKESDFEDIVLLAAAVCEAPSAAICFLDGKNIWFRAKKGIENDLIFGSIDAQAKLYFEKDIFIVDGSHEPKPGFAFPKLESGEPVIFCAGVPMLLSGELNTVILCVYDTKTRQLTDQQVQMLKSLRRQIERIFALKEDNIQKARQNDELYKMQSELLYTKNFMSTVLDTLPVALFCKDAADGFRYTLWNKTAQEMWGISADQALGKTDYDLWPKEQADFFRTMDFKTMQEGKAVDIPDELIDTKNQGQLHLHTKKVQVNNRLGIPQYLLGISEDITEKRAAELNLLHSSKMASLGEMAQGIAHEINNPLAIIRANAQHMQKTLQDPSFDKKLVDKMADTISNTTTRISKIINGLRAFARDGKNEPKANAELQTLVHEALSFCRSQFVGKNVELEVKMPEQPCYLECNAVQIVQVLLNLLNNAFSAVESLQEKWIKIEVLETPHNISVSLTDSGKGIPLEIRNKIMQPFFTTKDVGKGTGLGLSISKGIIESHGGTLDLDITHPNTRFVIQFSRKIK